MRRYNDTLIFILANLLGWLGPRQEPRRRPCRRAKCAGLAAGATRKASQEAPPFPRARSRLPGQSKRRAVGPFWHHRRGNAAPPTDRRMAHPRHRRRGGGFCPKCPSSASRSDWGSDFWNRQNAALLCGFDRVRTHPFAIDPACLGPSGQHRAQHAGPHFHRFFNHVILSCMFERREQIIKIRTRLLWPRQSRRTTSVTLFAVRHGNMRLPFAVAAIENKDLFTYGQAQHIADIICSAADRDSICAARAEGGVDIEARAAKS